MKIVIEPLSHSTLDKAKDVFALSLPYEETPPIFLEASLDKQNNKDFMTKYNVVDFSYFVAIDQDTSDVVGVTGIYISEEDSHEACWIDWTGVPPLHRGNGIGGLLINKVIVDSRKAGKKFVRVYTSTHPNELIARKLYAKRGFRVFREEPIQGQSFTRFFMELAL